MTNIKATTTKKTFSRETSVSVEIKSSADKIWKVLTDIVNYPKWNSTIVSISGEVELNKIITLVSTLDPSRTFKLKIKEVVENEKLVWGDMQGSRNYTLEKISDSLTKFTMAEKISSPLLPLFVKYIPEFDESFEQFATDLKKEVEKS